MNGVPDFITQALSQTSTPKAETPVAPETAKAVETPVETPATEAKPAEAPKADAPIFDFKTIDERLTSAEDVKKFLSERDTYASELESTKNKLSQFDGYIKPHDPEISKLNEIKAAGGNVDLFLQMRNIDPQSLSEADAVKLLMQFQDGLTSQDADRKVKILYKTSKDLKAIEAEIAELRNAEDLDKYNPKEASRLEEEMENIYLAQAELKSAGRKAKQTLSELKVQSQDVPNVQKIQEEIRSTWQPHVPKFIPKDFEIPFKIENPDKSVTDLKVKFALDSDSQKDINEFLQGTVEYFTSQGIPYDEEKAMKMLTEEVKYKVLGKNFDKISDMKVQAALEAERTRVKNAIHATPKTEEKVVTPQSDELTQQANQFFNIVKNRRVGALV